VPSLEFGAIRSTGDRRVTNRISWKSRQNWRPGRQHPHLCNNSGDLWRPNFALFLRPSAMPPSFYWQR
jgi:hypothetical protein